MGNLKFPRPNKIDFPSVEKKEWKIKRVSEKTVGEKKIIRHFCLLKSGNLLVNYLDYILAEKTVNTRLSIYKIPKLELVEEYVYNEEIDDFIYYFDRAFQSKEGNIIIICDKLYTFKGESISDGPEKESETINDINFLKTTIPFCESDDEDSNPNQQINFFNQAQEKEKKIIRKNAKYFNGFYFTEIKKDIFLYTELIPDNTSIFILDISQTKIKKVQIYQYPQKNIKNGNISSRLDIILPSEYYPDNFYICVNTIIRFYGRDGGSFQSELLCFNIEEFIKNDEDNNKPLFSIEVSKSQNIYGICEYNKKYILLDTYKKGIYIINIELKQKVAVCMPDFSSKLPLIGLSIYSDRKAGEGELYRKIEKLKDGQVFIRGKIIDIKEEKLIELAPSINFQRILFSGDYIISVRDSIRVIKLS